MSDTPLTEARVVFFGYNPDEGDEFVQADFARDLERQNTALREQRHENAKLKKLLRDVVLALEHTRIVCEFSNGHSYKDSKRLTTGMCIAIDALTKASEFIPDYQTETYWNDVKKLS